MRCLATKRRRVPRATNRSLGNLCLRLFAAELSQGRVRLDVMPFTENEAAIRPLPPRRSHTRLRDLRGFRAGFR
jgi:hypothetical protein